MHLTKTIGKIKFIDTFIIYASNLFVWIVRKCTIKNSIGNIVIISLHRLGDSVFTIPAIKKLYDNFPKDKTYVLTFSENTDIYRIYFPNEHLVTLKRKDFLWENRIASKGAKRELKSIDPFLIIDLTGNISSASLIMTSKAKRIVGTNSKYFNYLYDSFIQVRNEPHLMELYMDAAKRACQINYDSSFLEFPTSFNGVSKVLIHPFAGWKEKEWNLKKFIELAKLLKNDFEVELLSPPNAISNDVIEEIKKNGLKIAITESISDLIEKIKECSLFISNDSGPLYIASLLGKATFTVYGPTNPKYSMPFGKYHWHIQKELRCTPKNSQYCFTHAGLFCPSNECMSLMTVEEVHERILAIQKNVN